MRRFDEEVLLRRSGAEIYSVGLTQRSGTDV